MGDLCEYTCGGMCMPFLYSCCDELTGVSCAPWEACDSSSPTGCCIRGTECLADGTPIEDLESLVVDDENDEDGGVVVVPSDEDEDDDDDDGGGGGSDSNGDDDPAGINAGGEDNNDREAEDEEEEDSDAAADAIDAATALSERIAEAKRCLIGLGLAVIVLLAA